MQQEVRIVVQSEIKRQLAEIFSKEVIQAKKKSADSDLEQQILSELETMNESTVVEEPVKSVKKFVKYSNNPMLNEILNQTQPFTSAQRASGPSVGASVLDRFQSVEPIQESYTNSHIPNYMDAEPDIEGTLNMGSSLGAGGMEVMRAQMAAKMGYGDMGGSTKSGGLGVTTGLAGLDRILNRDNSELVKKFKR